MRVKAKPPSAQRSKQPRRSRRESVPLPPTKHFFPIVGIGASAGGLEALEGFLARVPKNTGMAFVIVQHLDPTRKGIMPELLQRTTSMRVVQVKDRTQVEPNCVYVIPPNKDMSILHGLLHLLDPVSPRGQRLPIDFFLRSLAQDQRGRSVGLILSGMGSDGTLGLRAIKEQGGVVLVQDPATAKFDGMPRSAIDSGLADIVAPVDELPGRILSFQRRRPLVHAAERPLQGKAQLALEKVIILLRTHTGHDFSLYKPTTFHRRIERRMGIHQIDTLTGYVRYLQENSQELDLLFKELLIGVTGFFRDPAAWQELAKRALPALLANRPAGQSLRAWVPACSTGEEAYSLAMVFREAMARFKPRRPFTLQVFATDLDKDAIEKARQGLYPENIRADVTPARLRRFFVRNEHGFRVAAEIREMVIFAPQSLIRDPPFTKLDLLSCRNLLIYFSPELQQNLFPLFHHSLNPGGILFLGSAETVGSFTHLFHALGSKSRLYRRLEAPDGVVPLTFPASFALPLAAEGEVRAAPVPAPNLQTLANQLILDRYAPSSVLVNDKGNILYVSGRTGKYLEPAAGQANWNIFAMAREGLRDELSRAFHQALTQEGLVVGREQHDGPNDTHQRVSMTLQRLDQPEALRGLVMIVFTDVPAPPPPPIESRTAKAGRAPARRAGQEALARKYEQARREAQIIREDMQTSQEELRSTNEEQQSTNEELQSTNEELTTSKEEMQSLNEELQTVNAELQVKLDELARANNDMKNLLNSTDIATLFLDNKLRVRRFTTQATKIIKLIPGDIGRPITDLASDLLYPGLPADARKVLRNLDFAEKTVRARGGRWFTARIMPYRTHDDHVDGVVITFADITAGKTMEAQLREKHTRLEHHVAKLSGQRPPGRPARANSRDRKRT